PPPRAQPGGLRAPPPPGQPRLERIDLVPVGGDGAVGVLATGTGWGTSRILTLEESVSPAELGEIARVLTERYGGQSFQEIRARLGGSSAPAHPDPLPRASAVPARKDFAPLSDKKPLSRGAANRP